MITLKNEVLTAAIDQKGAQLCSVKGKDGTEYIWQADPKVWGRHAPLLFPVIGRLKDSQYTLEGKTYTIGAHGFARDAMFEVVEQSETSVSLRITDSPETLEKWPFAFALTVTFALDGDKLRKTCQVENRSDRTMYYELGSHDGFNAPNCSGEQMSDWAVRLPGVDTLEPYGMNESCMLTVKERKLPLEHGRIPLKPMTYGLDTIVLSDLPCRTAQLVDGNDRVRVTMEFEDYDYLALWTMDMHEDTNYVCIEPWTTLPDAEFVGRDLTEKAGIRALAAGQSEQRTYTTRFS